MALNPPARYMLCQNSACAQAGNCLRYRSFQELTNETVSIQVLNPLRYPQGKGVCDHFCTAEETRVAWGIKDILCGLPYESARHIKQQLLSHFGRTKYYRFYREELPLLPADQDAIQSIFSQNGIDTAPAYTRFSEIIHWC